MAEPGPVALPSFENALVDLPRGPVDAVFTEAEVDGLPEPVRRYLQAAIAPATPLATAVRLQMRGSIKIVRWVPFRAEEVLVPHAGFVWRARVAGIISGADAMMAGRGGMLWKLLGIVPFVRASGTDYLRSATGRFGAEAMWLPTTLLPRFGVAWTAEDDRNITARFAVGEVQIELHFRIGADGKLLSLTSPRWRGAEGAVPAGSYPFGGDFTAHREFGGLTIPSEGCFGWFYGSDRWSEGEFFRYKITGLNILT